MCIVYQNCHSLSHSNQLGCSGSDNFMTNVIVVIVLVQVIMIMHVFYRPDQFQLQFIFYFHTSRWWSTSLAGSYLTITTAHGIVYFQHQAHGDEVSADQYTTGSMHSV